MSELIQKGRCPNCGGGEWIERTEWSWKTERWLYTADGNGDLENGGQFDQDGECDVTWACFKCGFKLTEAYSWDECWENVEECHHALDRIDKAMDPVLDRLKQRNEGVDPQATMSIGEIVDWAEQKFGQDDTDLAELRHLHEDHNLIREQRPDDQE